MDPRAPPARRGHHLKGLLASSCQARLDQPDRAVPADPPGAVSSQTMRVGIVGSGLMGGKLGTLFARAGHEVVFSYARSEQKLSELARTFPAKCCLPSSKPSANSPDPASCTAGTTRGARGSPPG